MLLRTGRLAWVFGAVLALPLIFLSHMDVRNQPSRPSLPQPLAHTLSTFSEGTVGGLEEDVDVQPPLSESNEDEEIASFQTDNVALIFFAREVGTKLELLLTEETRHDPVRDVFSVPVPKTMAHKAAATRFLHKELNLEDRQLLFLHRLKDAAPPQTGVYVSMLPVKNQERVLRGESPLRLPDHSNFVDLEVVATGVASNSSTFGPHVAQHLKSVIKFLQPWVVTAGKAAGACAAMLD